MINKNLKWLRNRFGFTLKDVSESLNIKVSTLSSYEERGIAPKYDTLLSVWKFYKPAFENLKLADLLETDLSKQDLIINNEYFDDKKIKTSEGYHTKKSKSLLSYNSTDHASKITQILETIESINASDLEGKSSIIQELAEAVKELAGAIKRKSSI